MPDLEPLPDVLHCARCTRSIARMDMIGAGWVIVSGQPLCPEDARRIAIDPIDGIEQSEPEEPDGVVLAVDAEQTLDMPGVEEDP